MKSASLRTTLKKLALEAKLSVAAVSMALRDHPRIGQATRERVQKLALKRGYQPDPALSALVAYRQDQRIRPTGSTIAVVYVTPKESHLSKQETKEEFKGISETAKRLGYSLDIFTAGLEENEQAQVLQVIRSRGIRGIIFQFLDADPSELKADWGFVAAVGTGIVARQSKLPLPSVCGDHFHGAYICLQELGMRRFKRPVLLIPSAYPAPLQTEIVGGYLAALWEQGVHTAPGEIRINFSLDGWKEKLIVFVEQTNPDVLICAGRARFLLEWLDTEDASALNHLSLCTLDAVNEEKAISGMLQDRHGVGVVAMESLHKLILANITGPAERSQAIFMPGAWRKGQTLKPLGGRRARKALVNA